MNASVGVDIDHRAAKWVGIWIDAVLHVQLGERDDVLAVGGCCAARSHADLNVVVGHIAGVIALAAA